MNLVILTASILAVASLRACAQDPPRDVVAVELRGRVLDGGVQPEKGLVAVTVELHRKDDPAKTPPQSATSTDGTYKFKDVAPGSYVIRFTKNGFVRRPHPLATEVAKSPAVHNVADVLLFKETIDDEYAKSTARALASRGKGGKLSAEWERFEMTQVSLPDKAKVAAQLLEADASAKQIVEVRAFANPDVRKLAQLDQAWRKAWVDGDEAAAELVKRVFDGHEKDLDSEMTQFLVIDAMARALVQDDTLDRSKVQERIRKELPAAGAQLQKRLAIYKEL